MLAWVPTLSSNLSMGVSHQWLVNGFSRFHCASRTDLKPKRKSKSTQKCPLPGASPPESYESVSMTIILRMIGQT